jgi:hypothetical protein
MIADKVPQPVKQQTGNQKAEHELEQKFVSSN